MKQYIHAIGNTSVEKRVMLMLKGADYVTSVHTN